MEKSKATAMQAKKDFLCKIIYLHYIFFIFLVCIACKNMYYKRFLHLEKVSGKEKDSGDIVRTLGSGVGTRGF